LEVRKSAREQKLRVDASNGGPRRISLDRPPLTLIFGPSLSMGSDSDRVKLSSLPIGDLFAALLVGGQNSKTIQYQGGI
jgi:hypothetical protein